MGKNDFNTKEIIKIISFPVLLMWILDNINIIGSLLTNILNILNPFILALVIAFILNGPMKKIEDILVKTFPRFKDSKAKRVLSYTLTLLFFLGIIGLISFLIIPELIETSKKLSKDIPLYWNSILESGRFKVLVDTVDIDELTRKIDEFLDRDLINWINSSFLVITNTVSKITTFVIGFILSIYILLQKEKLALQSKKVIYAYLPEEVSDKIVEILQLTSTTFSRFMGGQVLESTILGIMFLIAMLIMKLPYAVMISLVIAITSLIPTIGSFIGCIFGVFLIGVSNYKQALLFLIVFLIIQQIEGNLIYPKVVGKASGLSSLWVMVAITLGGSLFGIIGIITFIPIFSVIGKLLKENIEIRLINKKIELK